jgi:hypothetical protein
MTPGQRDSAYVALGLVNTVLMICVMQNAFADAPTVAHWVAIASFVTAALMKQFGAKDTATQGPAQ